MAESGCVFVTSGGRAGGGKRDCNLSLRRVISGVTVDIDFFGRPRPRFVCVLLTGLLACSYSVLVSSGVSAFDLDRPCLGLVFIASSVNTDLGTCCLTLSSNLHDVLPTYRLPQFRHSKL